jgi:Leucine-rich repeat (LRR) protein
MNQDVFRDLTDTEWIFVNKNSIVEFPARLLDDIKSLGFFLAQGNSLATLPENFLKRAANVRVLNLRSNQIKVLPSLIFAHDLPKLENIDLSQNQLAEIPYMDKLSGIYT